MISLKDYAAQKNISYEAVRKSVARYKNELEGHIVKVDRTQYLDDEAVAFLDERREKNPIIIMQQDKDAEIDQLRREKEQLKDKLIAAQEMLLQQKDEIARLTAENNKLLTAAPAQEDPDEITVEADMAHGEEVAIDAEPVDPPAAQPAAPEQKLPLRDRIRILFQGKI